MLFSALDVPDDDLKVLVMECLLEVPISNLQQEEVQNIVNIVAQGDNLSVGRTEEILGHTFSILRKLALDDGEEGAHFRRFQGATIHMALDILVRNSSRDTRGQRQETEEKAALSTACVSFLRASSFEWTEAIELMQTRDAVEAMMQAYDRPTPAMQSPRIRYVIGPHGWRRRLGDSCGATTRRGPRAP